MIIVLNGPPHSGKDTIANYLVNTHDFVSSSFKHTLYRMTAEAYGVDLNWFKQIAQDRKLKESSFAELQHNTPREALINVSENIIKPQYGESFFGEALAERITDVMDFIGNRNIVISDGGFGPEIEPLHQKWDTLIVRLHGRGSFENDSRDYIMQVGYKYLDIHLEEGRPDLAVTQIMDYIK